MRERISNRSTRDKEGHGEKTEQKCSRGLCTSTMEETDRKTENLLERLV